MCIFSNTHDTLTKKLIKITSHLTKTFYKIKKKLQKKITRGPLSLAINMNLEIFNKNVVKICTYLRFLNNFIMRKIKSR